MQASMVDIYGPIADVIPSRTFRMKQQFVQRHVATSANHHHKYIGILSVMQI